MPCLQVALLSEALRERDVDPEEILRPLEEEEDEESEHEGEEEEDTLV